MAGRSKVYVNAWFARFASKNAIADLELSSAVKRADDGLVDADLGLGVIKQRLSRRGEGRLGGFRAIVLYNRRNRAVFVYGFPKSGRENIDKDELKAFRALADQVLRFSEEEMNSAVEAGVFAEVLVENE